MTGRILIADSLATNRITLKVRLQAACYDVATASTLDHLRAALRDGRPDLVIIGTGLADIAAVDLCRRLRRDMGFSGLPVLMLASGTARLDAMRVGANAVLDPKADEAVLLARIRGLLRFGHADPAPAMAEAAAPFTQPVARITLIADTPARALCWKHLLGGRMPHHFLVNDSEQALADVAAGRPADLYVIAADLAKPGDGLRLLSELRSRPLSRDAGFVVATRASSDATAAIALDLGAGDVLPLELGGTIGVEAAALSLTGQLARKWHEDRKRAEAALNIRWAMTDPLTGLYNRRYALPQLTDHVARHAEGEPRFAILIVDLDRFKSINDRYGHAAGDSVLCAIAERMRQTAGDDAMIARLGGEEFLLLLPDADEATAWARAERIRRAIMDRPVELPPGAGVGNISVTLSVGVAIAEQSHCRLSGESPDLVAQRMIDRADRAMLAAKSMGRNRVLLAQAEHAA